MNGCQTSHVLFRNRSAVDADMFIPVKLVATDDKPVIAEVITYPPGGGWLAARSPLHCSTLYDWIHADVNHTNRRRVVSSCAGTGKQKGSD